MDKKNTIICITSIKHIKNAYENLSKFCKIIYDPYISQKKLKKVLIDNKNIIGIFTNPNKQQFKIDKEILDRTNVKVICTASTGTNHIDMEYGKNNDIEVLSLTKDYNIIKKISSTAELSFALMLSLIRNIPKSMNAVMSYEWDYEKYIGRQLNYMTVGIIGYGRLGKIFARFCEPFFKEIIVCDSYKKIKKYRQEGLCKLLLHSDVIVLHVHLNDETYHMINDKTISSYMKQGCYLINTSRGDVVDERAVIRGLKNNIISGYATDVLSDELGSNINKSPIIKEMNKGANIIVTPHIGGMTIEAQEIAYLHSIEKLNKFLNN